MAPNTNSCASSKPEYLQMVSHIVDISKEPEVLNTSESYIYRVPCNLRKLKEEAYTPLLISIGPLHYGQKHLEPMQQQKLRYFGYFWVRVNDEAAMKGYKEYLAKEEKAIRNCYAEKFPHFTTDQFVDLMLLDAVFIMELFLRIQENKPEHKDDSILKQTWLNKGLERDLLLLENQIPLVILDKLYSDVIPDTDKKHNSFIELAYEYFKCFHPYKRSNSSSDETQKLDVNHKLSKSKLHFSDLVSASKKESSYRFGLLKEKWKNESLHFTDLVRYFYLYEGLNLRVKGTSCHVLRTAKKLQEAGVSFEKVFDRHLLNIKFEKVPILSWLLCLGCISKLTCFKARLQIPQLKVDDTTECILRNLIALEQCHYAHQPYICNYVSLIDSLIHTKDDVELLVEKEVIVHELGSDKEVATLVNGLCKHVVTDNTCYKDVIDDLNGHYQRVWNRSMAALRLVYFRDPWRASSTVVGIAVLIFAVFNFCRVVRSVLSHQPPQPLF